MLRRHRAIGLAQPMHDVHKKRQKLPKQVNTAGRYLFSQTSPVKRGQFFLHVEEPILAVRDLTQHLSELFIQSDFLLSQLKPGGGRWVVIRSAA